MMTAHMPDARFPARPLIEPRVQRLAIESINQKHETHEEKPENHSGVNQSRRAATHGQSEIR
jgi:hypothetical protein